MLLDEPRDLATTSWIPASSRMGRAAPPAITPGPGCGGLQWHPPGPGLTDHRVSDVEPASGTLKRLFLASSMPFWTASPASLAFP